MDDICRNIVYSALYEFGRHKLAGVTNYRICYIATCHSIVFLLGEQKEYIANLVLSLLEKE